MDATINQGFRYSSIDKLRGFVIVLMGLDHVRTYFSPYLFAPENLDLTNPALFLTRWVTHFCAPIFIFLAGMGAHLYQSKGYSKHQTAQYLLSRGLWLIFIEITVVNLSWRLGFSGLIILQVIWVIGWSMIILAGLIYLPVRIIAAVGLVALVGHNLFDSVTAQSLGKLSWLWNFLHQPGVLYSAPKGQFTFFVAYPLVPWFAVMALGYCFSYWIMGRPQQFVRRCLIVGLSMTAAFILLRYSNFYGDASLWQEQARGSAYTFLSFLNVSKYPPSLLFVLMTIGPGLVILGLLQHYDYKGLGILQTFGRVPFFYYVLHIPALHGAAVLYFSSLPGAYVGWQLDLYTGSVQQFPVGYEPSLLRCYIAWLVISALLYGLCYWYKKVKQRHSLWIFRYL